jgi:hypothetical protein
MRCVISIAAVILLRVFSCCVKGVYVRGCLGCQVHLLSREVEMTEVWVFAYWDAYRESSHR